MTQTEDETNSRNTLETATNTYDMHVIVQSLPRDFSRSLRSAYDTLNSARATHRKQGPDVNVEAKIGETGSNYLRKQSEKR